ncbi:predicted Hydrolase or acyltransferase (alpha/beta hydrolase superfamily) [Hahella chejuensis KCTC 2396]|uniref:Predicted Hydrolase or acyltransferase (Alpha/beta hydrolase superfamily) n=1 Tax=Hahella chejuensis (strain KCTC 2396) TaxID=349521 RepID=Q2SNN5_HAHCH|nr:alpha/beta fold hydrolase [Hahella chejuensis]ABC27739.1 predicted Hydrolase or acyltransferase (alpha/beta hydrolase superfamily) [Hahella chejuensis KCTC 2396]
MSANIPLVVAPSKPLREPQVPFALKAMRWAIRAYARISSQGAGRMLNRLWFTPQRYGVGSRFDALLDKADAFMNLKVGALTIPVYSWGSGPVVLCAHGWSGSGVQFGAMVAPLVEKGYRVVAFDAPGHGRAQGVRTNVLQMRDAILAVAAQTLGVHAVVAHSLGSIAAAMAVREGLLTNKVIMLAPPADMQVVLDVFQQRLQVPDAVMLAHCKLMEQEFGDDIWDRLSLMKNVPLIQAEGMIVSDINDAEVPAAYGEALALKWRGSRFLQTAGLGHYRVLRDESVIEEVVKFINRLPD